MGAKTEDRFSSTAWLRDYREQMVRLRPCRGCVTLSTRTLTCDYLLLTGHRRPCPAGTKCTVKVLEGDTSPVVRRTTSKPRKSRRTWDAEKAMELYNQGATDQEIAAAVGASASSIGTWRREELLPAHVQDRHRRFDTDRARELLATGKLDKEVAEELGTSVSVICAWRQAEGIKANGKGRKLGSGVRFDADQARALLAAGYNDAQVAERVGAAKSTIAHWRNLERIPPNRKHKKGRKAP